MDESHVARDVTQKFAYVFRTPPGSLYPPLLDERRLVAGEAAGVRRGRGGRSPSRPSASSTARSTRSGLRIGSMSPTRPT